MYRKDVQDKLLLIKNRETFSRLTGRFLETSTTTKRTGRNVTEIETYKSLIDLPSSKNIEIQVDAMNECMIIPLMGVRVPFHVLTIRNITSQPDGDHAYIRVNFNFSQNYEPSEKFPHMTFLKEVTYRTSSLNHASKVND